MKVLFVGHFHEKSGWGQAAKDYALALDSVGIDVVCRSVRFNDSGDVDERLKPLLAKDLDGATVCIQNVLPHLMCYDSSYYNIGLWFEEYQHKYSPWTPYLKLMDALWVPNRDMSAYRDLDSTVVHPPYDFNKVKKVYKKLSLPNEGNYTFYFIGEINKRKHITALLRAFHSEFSGNEPVSLVLKVYKYGQPAEVARREINEMCLAVKKELGKYKEMECYNKEIIITEYIPEYGILELHNTCDCFVAPSFGEGWCIPAFDALAMGKQVIGSDTGGLADFLPVESKTIGVMEPTVSNHGFPGFGNGNETWLNVSISDLMYQMRFAYNNSQSGFLRRNLDMLEEEYSYEVIGNQMKQLLVEVENRDKLPDITFVKILEQV
jgi:glycosyltransferase involved in cell wall biosynthesis